MKYNVWRPRRDKLRGFEVGTREGKNFRVKVTVDAFHTEGYCKCGGRILNLADMEFNFHVCEKCCVTVRGL